MYLILKHVALVGIGFFCESETNPKLMLDKDERKVSKFLNRTLGMTVEVQKQIFQHFTDTLLVIVKKAKRSSCYDIGILDSNCDDLAIVKRTKLYKFAIPTATPEKSNIELHCGLEIDRGMSWKVAFKKFSELKSTNGGFYLSTVVSKSNKSYLIILVFLI